MNCEQFNHSVVDFHFSSLDHQQYQQMESHLLSCKTCLMSFLKVKQSADLKIPSPGIDRELDQKILNVIFQKTNTKLNHGHRLRAIALVAIITVICAGIYQISTDKDSMRLPPQVIDRNDLITSEYKPI